MASMSMRARLLNTAVFEYEPAAPVLRMYIPDLKCPLELQRLQNA